LVPSRYALRVGGIDVLVISDGVLRLPTATLATNVDPAILATWLDDNFLPPDVLDWPLNVVVVRSGDRTILIDAGIGAEYPDFPKAGHLALRLDAAGIDPASVTDVVLTHMHMDHVGGLLDDGLRGRLRPDLPIHVAAAEAEFWASPDFSRTSMPPPVPPVLRSVARRILDEYRSQLRLFEAEHEVAPGVVVRRTGGHTPGHSVVSLASGGRAADVSRRRHFPGRVRPPRLAQRLRTRPRGGGPRPGPSLARGGSERRAAGGYSPFVPVHRPGGGRRRRLSLGTSVLGLLTACWVRGA
jgi:glyoxylase-like metal-dependent hydrolase (beta-lactamase superfamily II)